MLGTAAIASGLLEAFVLYVVVNVATALAGGEDHLPLGAGPLGNAELSIGGALAVGAVAVCALMLVNVAANALAARTVTRSVLRASTAAFDAFLRADWWLQSREGEGQLQQALTGNVLRLSHGLTQLMTAISAGFNLATFMVAAFVISPLVAATVVVGVTVVGGVLVPLSARTRSIARQGVRATHEFAGEISQAVSIARDVHAFGVEEPVAHQVARANQEVQKAQARARFLQGVTPVAYKSLALALVIGAMLVVHETAPDSVADLGAIVIILVRALSFGQQLAGVTQQAHETAPYLEQVAALRETYEAARRPRGDRALTRVERVELRDLSYGYDPHLPVLRHLDLTVHGGEAIGVVGPSGGGKSTLVQVLLALRRADSGAYLVNGVDVDEYAPGHWARHCSYVPQDNRLVHGTVRENIRFFRPGLTDEDVEAAARRSHLHEDVSRWDLGYDTVIGPGAQDLSGGQRQRLGLARALVTRPGLLVLDEPTSALDMRSEELVQRTLEDLRGSVTLVIVAHRLSTLNLCDRIVVLEQGRVAAVGTHHQVATDSKFFRDAQRLSGLLR
ncbi:MULTISPECIES: ABC transporter ATP-binding protein [unclassified Blastococcus]